MRRRFLVVFRSVLAALTVAAIATQFAATLAAGADPVRFFSFFTIVANTYAAGVWTYASVARRPSRTLDQLRGAATFYLAVVGIVFTVLLTNVESDILPWVNDVLHRVVPIAVLLDWIVDPPHYRLVPRAGFTWLVPLAVYLAYTFVRGAIVHWYPYPFLDVGTIGARAVATYCVAIFAFAIAAAQLVIALGNARTRSRQRAQPPHVE